MNYKSQLKGWAIDRVIELWKATGGKYGEGSPMECLQKQADELAAFAYVAREDFESTAKDLFDLVRNAPPGKADIDALIGTLEHIKNDRIAQRIDVEHAETVQ